MTEKVVFIVVPTYVRHRLNLEVEYEDRSINSRIRVFTHGQARGGRRCDVLVVLDTPSAPFFERQLEAWLRVFTCCLKPGGAFYRYVVDDSALAQGRLSSIR